MAAPAPFAAEEDAPMLVEAEGWRALCMPTRAHGETEGAKQDIKRNADVDVEVRMTSTSAAEPEAIKESVRRWLERMSVQTRSGPMRFETFGEPFLDEHVASILLTGADLEFADVDEDDEDDSQAASNLTNIDALRAAPVSTDVSTTLLFWQVRYAVYVYQAAEDEPCTDFARDPASNDAAASAENAPSYREWALPHRLLDGTWDALELRTGVKEALLAQARVAKLLGRAGVRDHVVAGGRSVLVHGPPGTGKTTLCRALAHKLACRSQFVDGGEGRNVLVEVDAHRLYSRWFSESGKLVGRLFARIAELADELEADDHGHLYVLIDEVESVAADRSRASSGSGGEPADAVRAVNALLTCLDALRRRANVTLLCTSNLPDAIDAAFLDRVDLTLAIPRPNCRARYRLLHAATFELVRTGVIRGGLPEYVDVAVASRLARAMADGDGDGDGLGAETHHMLPAVALYVAASRLPPTSGRRMCKLPATAVAKALRESSGVEAVSLFAFVASLRETVEQWRMDMSSSSK